MLELVVAGVSLDLIPDQEITLNFNNPAFDATNTDRGVSLPFRLQMTERNGPVFGKADLLNCVRAQHRQYPCQLRISGQQVYTGYLRVRKVRPRQLEVNFYNEAYRFLEGAGDTKLAELGLGQHDVLYQSFTPVNYLVTFQEQAGQGTFVLFINIGSDQYQQPHTTNVNSINFTLTQFALQINADYPGAATVTGNELALDVTAFGEPTVTFSPQQAGRGWRDAGSNPKWEARAKAWQYHLAINMIGEQYTSHVFPPVRNFRFYEDNPGWENIINYYSGTEYPLNEPQADQNAWQYNVVPMVFVNWVLLKIGEKLGRPVVMDGTAKELAKKLILANNHCLDEVEPDTFVSAAFEPTYRNKYRDGYDLDEHVPDITVKDFLQHYMELLGLVARVGRNKVQILGKEETLAGNLLDFTGVAIPTWVVDVKDTDGVCLQYDGDRMPPVTSVFGVDLAPGQLEPYKQGSTEKLALDYTSAITTYRNVEHEDRLSADPRTILVPHTGKEGSNAACTVDPKLLFYRGKQPDSAGDTYPLASHGRFDLLGNVTGDNSLEFGGEGGLVQRHWNRYVKLKTADRIEVRLLLDIADIFKLARFPRIMIKFKSGQVIGTIVKYQATIRPGETFYAKAVIARG